MKGDMEKNLDVRLMAYGATPTRQFEITSPNRKLIFWRPMHCLGRRMRTRQTSATKGCSDSSMPHRDHVSGVSLQIGAHALCGSQYSRRLDWQRLKPSYDSCFHWLTNEFSVSLVDSVHNTRRGWILRLGCNLLPLHFLPVFRRALFTMFVSAGFQNKDRKLLCDDLLLFMLQNTTNSRWWTYEIIKLHKLRFWEEYAKWLNKNLDI